MFSFHVKHAAQYLSSTSFPRSAVYMKPVPFKRCRACSFQKPQVISLQHLNKFPCLGEFQNRELAFARFFLPSCFSHKMTRQDGQVSPLSGSLPPASGEINFFKLCQHSLRMLQISCSNNSCFVAASCWSFHPLVRSLFFPQRGEVWNCLFFDKRILLVRASSALPFRQCGA